MTNRKKTEILDALKSHGMTSSNQIDGSNTRDQGQLLGAGCSDPEFTYVQLLTNQQIIIRVLLELSLHLG